MKRIKILDSCRGIAALIVVFHHVYTRCTYLYPQESTMKIHGLLNFISELNGEAVLFFFILSGFSIRLSLKNGLPIRKPALNEYLYRRFKRILPLYLLALCFTFVCGLLIHQTGKPDYSIRSLLGNVLFLQTPVSYRGFWFAPYGENGPLWSLSFEMFYYLFFPLFIFAFVRMFKSERFTGMQEKMVLGVAFVLSIACILANSYFFFPYIAFARFFFLWYCGYFLADIYIKGAVRPDANFMTILFFCAAVGGLVVLRRSDSLVELFKGMVILTVFYFLCILRKTAAAGIMVPVEKGVNAIFFHLGKGSYALYLLHYPVILVLKSFAHVNLPVIVVTMAVLAFICIQLEEFFVRQKFPFLRLQYIR